MNHRPAPRGGDSLREQIFESLAAVGIRAFRIELGQGSYATVYAGEIESQPCAVKIAKVPLDHSPNLQRELDRGRVVWPLTREHVGLVTFYQHEVVSVVTSRGESHQYLVTVWERAERSLDGLLEGEQTIGRLDAFRYLEPVAAAIDFLHSHQQYHRDVKPQNILLFEDGRTKLGDLGTVRIGAPGGKATRVGTPAFAPPELLEAGVAHTTCDLYCLAGTYVTMLSASLPTGGHWQDSYDLEELNDRKKNRRRISKSLQNLGFAGDELAALLEVLHPQVEKRLAIPALEWIQNLKSIYEKRSRRLPETTDLEFSLSKDLPEPAAELGLTTKVLQELVARSIGRTPDNIPRRLSDDLEAVGVYRAKQLAYELVETVKHFQEALRRMRVKLVRHDPTDTDKIITQHEFIDVWNDHETLRGRVDADCVNWKLYLDLVIPIYRELDMFCADIRKISEGYIPKWIPRPDKVSFESKPTLPEFTDRVDYYLKAIERISLECREWQEECDRFYRKHCRLLDD